SLSAGALHLPDHPRPGAQRALVRRAHRDRGRGRRPRRRRGRARYAPAPRPRRRCPAPQPGVRVSAVAEPIAVSDRARALLRGAYDTHIHVAPDVVPRIVDDVTLAQRFATLGMDGFILKSHYTSTAERASVVRAAVPGIQALGAIVLNRAVGGMNALAVEVAARGGVRTVWLPTVDSVNESHERDAPAGARVPVWVKLQLELREQGIEIPPVPVVDESGAVLPETRAVLEPIAHHGLVLATGHLARDEIFAVVDAAIETGVTQIVITHPEFPAQNLSVEDQNALAGRGALLERCMTTPHTGKIAWVQW